MLNLFKSNNPGVIIFYVFYLVLFRACFYFISPDASIVFQYHEPLSKSLFVFLKHLPFNFQVMSLVLSAVLCMAQAILVNEVVNANKILPKKNYLPGVCFIIFFSFFHENLWLTPSSIALTCLIICTGKIFSLARNEKGYSDIFDMGFLVAIASLFYFPAILFIVFAYIGLATVRPFTTREWIITLMGFVSAFFLVFVIYFWNNHTDQLWKDLSNSYYKGWLVGLNSLTANNYTMLGFMLVCIIASLAFLPGILYSTLIQVRKFATTLVFFMFLVVISISLQQIVNVNHFVLMSLPLSIFFSMLLFQIKRNWISEVIHLILILLVLAGQYLPIMKTL